MKPTLLGLLEAIREEPDEDDPRLIAADWLEEQNDPRGELFRAQCTSARLPGTHPQSQLLNDRAAALYSQHWKQWLGSPPAHPSDYSQAELERGMISVSFPNSHIMGSKAYQEWLEQHLPWITKISWRGIGEQLTHQSDLSKKLLAHLRWLEMRLYSNRPDELKILDRLPDLRALEISGPIVVAVGDSLRPLSRLARLQRLSIDRFTFQRGGRWLTRLSSLRSLHLRNIGTQQVRILSEIPSLRELSLTARTGQAEQALSTLASLPHLHKVEMAMDRMTVPGMAALCSLEQIRSLDLRAFAYRDGIHELGRLTRLEELALQINGLEDPSWLNSLTELPLRQLRLRMTFSGMELSSLAKLSHLESLCLGYCSITDPHLSDLGSMVSLRELSLTGNHRITDAGLEPLRELPQLEMLNLREAAITDEAVTILCQFPRLKWLSLSRTEISSSAIERLQQDRPDIQVVLP